MLRCIASRRMAGTAVFRPQILGFSRARALCSKGEASKPTESSETAVDAAPLTNARGEVKNAYESILEENVCRAYWHARASLAYLIIRLTKLCACKLLQIVKNWGSSVDLPAVSKQEAEEAYLDATSVTRAVTPAVAEAVAARDDMLKDRFNYVSQHVTNPAAQYVVMGADKKAVAPAAIGQGSFLIAGIIVVLSGIAAVVYVKTQW